MVIEKSLTNILSSLWEPCQIMCIYDRKLLRAYKSGQSNLCCPPLLGYQQNYSRTVTPTLVLFSADHSVVFMSNTRDIASLPSNRERLVRKLFPLLGAVGGLVVCNYHDESQLFYSLASHRGHVCKQQGTHGTGHGTGKTGKMVKNIPCQGKHREFGNFAKTQGIWFAQVVNSLILKVKDIAIFAAKFSSFFQKLDRSAKSFFCPLL